MESTQGASTDNQSSSNNITTKQSTTPETTNILCQTKSVSTIHTANDNTSINTKQPAAMLHFKELENQLARERAQQQTDAIAAQQSFEKGPKMIPINVIPQQHQHYNSGGAAGREEDEDSLDDAKNYRLPIGIRKMNEKARAEKLARQQELIRLSQERLKNMPAGVKHFNKMDNDKPTTNSSSGSVSNNKKVDASKVGSVSNTASTSKGREAPPPPASVATEYFRKKELERIQAKLNETSITENDEPGSSSDALSADHLDA